MTILQFLLLCSAMIWIVSDTNIAGDAVIQANHAGTSNDVRSNFKHDTVGTRDMVLSRNPEDNYRGGNTVTMVCLPARDISLAVCIQHYFLRMRSPANAAATARFLAFLLFQTLLGLLVRRSVFISASFVHGVVVLMLTGMKVFPFCDLLYYANRLGGLYISSQCDCDVVICTVQWLLVVDHISALQPQFMLFKTSLVSCIHQARCLCWRLAS